MLYDASGQHAQVEAVSCPECKGVFLTHAKVEYNTDPKRGPAGWIESDQFILWPRVSARPPIRPDVPEQYASLAREAGLILADSPRASARALAQVPATAATERGQGPARNAVQRD